MGRKESNQTSKQLSKEGMDFFLNDADSVLSGSVGVLVTVLTLGLVTCSTNSTGSQLMTVNKKWIIIEQRHEISNKVVSTSKASDQPMYMRSLIRAFACCLNIL